MISAFLNWENHKLLNVAGATDPLISTGPNANRKRMFLYTLNVFYSLLKSLGEEGSPHLLGTLPIFEMIRMLDIPPNGLKRDTLKAPAYTAPHPICQYLRLNELLASSLLPASCLLLLFHGDLSKAPTCQEDLLIIRNIYLFTSWIIYREYIFQRKQTRVLSVSH